MPRVAYALLLALVVVPFSAGAAGHDVFRPRRRLPSVLFLLVVLFPLSLFAVGHDVATERYAPLELYAGSASSVAFNGKYFLTLWPMGFHVYGSLAAPATGRLSQAFPAIPFANPYALQLTAADDGYLAIWSDTGGPSLGTFCPFGDPGRRVRLEADTFRAPRLAFNGTNALVVDQNTGIEVSVYDLDGRLVTRLLLPVAGDESYAVTSSGNDFLVVTAGRSGVNEWRLNTEGTILSTLQIQPPTTNRLSQYDVAVTSKNGRIAIAWEQQQLATVSSAVIQPDGSVSRSELPTDGTLPARGMTIQPVDIGFFVAWHEHSLTSVVTGVFAVRLDDTGTPLDARPVNLGIGAFSAAASSGKAVELTVYSSTRGQTMLTATVDANGISTETTTQSPITLVRQLFPVVTGNGAGFTAAWLDWLATSQSGMAGRVTMTGEPLDRAGIDLGPLAGPPAIAHGSSGELIVGNVSGRLVATRLSPAGKALDMPPFLVALLQSPYASYSVAWNGSRFFVVWADGSALFGAFVGPDGTATPPRPLGMQTPPLTAPADPDLAWDGHQFVVVYGEISQSGPCLEGCVRTPDHVRVLRVSAGGIAVDAVPVAIPGIHFRAHIASSGAESLIALDGYSDTTAMIVRDTGGVLQLGAEIPIFHWITTYGSDVTWTGSLYVVAWRYAFSQTGPGWIGVSKIGPSGVPFASLVTPTAGPAESGPPLSTPSIAANDSGDAAVVISEMTPRSYVARARLYLMSELAPMPGPPPPPRNVVMYSQGTTNTIVWQADGSQDAFAVEISGDGKNWSRPIVTDAQRLTISASSPGMLYRVSAIGPGGLSQPVVAAAGRVERVRAAR
jgi:hypothetical protein